MNLTAPTTGTYQGVLFFGDRSHAPASGYSFSGSSSGTTGTLYFPGASLSWAGSTTTQFQALIADNITMSGNCNFKKDVSGVYTAIAAPKIGLIQ